MLQNPKKHQKEIYERKVHGSGYSEGNLVWVFTPVVKVGKTKKLYKPWRGPYLVTEKLGDQNYRVKPTANLQGS